MPLRSNLATAIAETEKAGARYLVHATTCRQLGTNATIATDRQLAVHWCTGKNRKLTPNEMN